MPPGFFVGNCCSEIESGGFEHPTFVSKMVSALINPYMPCSCEQNYDIAFGGGGGTLVGGGKSQGTPLCMKP